MLESGFYNMDCMDGMREFPDKFFDLAIVDPPYGVNRSTLNFRSKREIYKNEAPDGSYWEELFRVSKNQIAWGGNHYHLPISTGWIVWYKHQPIDRFSDGELAWTSFDKILRIFDYPYTNVMEGSGAREEKSIHPTQKPTALYEWLLQNYAHKGDKILDTHVGSASSLIACHRMGFEYWGFELDADYYKAASERLAKEKEMQPLFAPQEIYKQGALEI